MEQTKQPKLPIYVEIKPQETLAEQPAPHRLVIDLLEVRVAPSALWGD